MSSISLVSILSVLLEILVGFSSASAQHCINYTEYLHWVGGVPTELPVGLPPSVTAVAATGDYAYIGRDYTNPNQFEIVDVRDATNPGIVSGLNLGDSVSGIVVVGGYAYATTPSGGLFVIDVSEPRDPQVTGHLDVLHRAQDIAVSGSYAYIADDSAGLKVIDITDPTAPAWVGGIDTPDRAWGVAVGGSYAYVADEDSGLHIIDISKPQFPSIEFTVDTPGQAWGVAAGGGFAYVADGIDRDSGLQIVDLSERRIVGAVPFHGAGRVDIAGEFAFVAGSHGGGSRLRVIDISNPSAPAVVGNGTENSLAVAVFGNHAYVGTTLGLHIFDATNPTSPSSVGIAPGGGDAGIAVNGRYAYAGSGWDSPPAFNVIDVEDPALPAVVASIPMSSVPHDIVTDGNYAYLAAFDQGLVVIDISAPGFPIVGSAAMPGSAIGVAVAASYAYIARRGSATGGALEVVNVSDPHDPRIVRTVLLPGDPEANDAHDVAVAGGYAYVVAWGGALHVVDISEPEGAYIVGGVNVPGAGSGVAVAGSHAYVATGWGGLQVVDISEPTAPYIIGESYAPGARNVAVSGNTVYLSESRYVWQGGGCLWVVDVSDPASPRPVGNVAYPTEGYPHVAIANGYIYVTGYKESAQSTSDVVIWPVHCDETTAVPADAGPGVVGVPLLTAEPNPASSLVRLAFDLPHPAKADIRIYDVAGRCVRRLVDAAMPAGLNSVTWDRRDDNGRIVAGGVYVARLTWADGSASRRVVMAR